MFSTRFIFVALLNLATIPLFNLATSPQATELSRSFSPRICLIGAGITSATISHFLTESDLTPSPHITVFERSSRVGGRIATVKLPTTHEVIDIEAGASIIADANLLMRYFIITLNLTRKSTWDRTLGLWNGNAFILRTVSGEGSARSKVRFLKRYGLSLVRMQRYVAEMVESHSQVYPDGGADAEWEPYESVRELFQRSGMLYNLSQIPLAEYVTHKFGTRLRSELIAAITRANYGQDPKQMNAFSGTIALAGSGSALWAVREGNEQVVKGLFKRAGVEIRLNTTVQRVKAEKLNGQNVYELESEGDTWTCDAVVLAAPYELSGVKLPRELEEEVDVKRTFHKTVATFVRGFLNTGTFGQDPPDAVLTTEGVMESFTSVGAVWKGVNGEPSIFKVFSPGDLDRQALKRMFMEGAEILASYPWLAYPNFSPPEKFPCFTSSALGGTFIYTSPLESAGSAMEMSAVSGANAAALLRKTLKLHLSAGNAQLDEKDEL